MGRVIKDDGVTVARRVISVGDYLDRYPDALVAVLATGTNSTVSRIRFWLQTHQVINLDGEGKLIADYALANGHITAEQHVSILA